MQYRMEVKYSGWMTHIIEASSLEEAKYQQFCINFYADAFIAAFVRWLSDKDCVPPQEFVRMLKVSIYAAVKRVEVAEL